MTEDCIKIGEYIVIQKQNYKKLHKFNKSDSHITVGRDTIHLFGIEGCTYHSIFKIISKSNKKKREYSLELTNEVVSLKDEIDVKSSGTDNRNIIDDGHSQKLSASEIEDLKSDSNKASDIVETLIINSNTFHNKTEYSQDKYLKKKEKKYFEYLQIIRPNLRMIAEIMYKLEPTKIQGLRLDTLSQMISYSNISSEGNYLLYDSGSNGLVAASLLNAIGPQTDGKLVHMHPGNMSQKQALLALNLSEEQFSRCISVNVYSVLRQCYQGCDTHDTKKQNGNDNVLKRKAETDCDIAIESKLPKISDTSDPVDVPEKPEELTRTTQFNEPKKPKWHFDNIEASKVLQEKVDSLVIVCKEDPQNIFKELIKFVKPSRPFVIYYSVAEPLQHLFLSLKSQSNVAGLNLTSNWMRNYQILPDRTHPEVMMNGSSGFLLTGYVLK